MKCSLCGDGPKVFDKWIQCTKNHSFHKKCLKQCVKSYTIHQMVSDCKDCIHDVVSKFEKTELCIKCQIRLDKTEIVCDIYKHYCSTCDESIIIEDHYLTCH